MIRAFSLTMFRRENCCTASSSSRMPSSSALRTIRRSAAVYFKCTILSRTAALKYRRSICANRISLGIGRVPWRCGTRTSSVLIWCASRRRSGRRGGPPVHKKKRGKTVLETLHPDAPEALVRTAKVWVADSSEVMLGFIWSAYDVLLSDPNFRSAVAEATDDIERGVTRLLHFAL